MRPHGTVAAYNRHRYHGEDPCDRCRRANADYHAKRRKVREKIEPPEHGTLNAYTNYGCRCEKCRMVVSIKI